MGGHSPGPGPAGDDVVRQGAAAAAAGRHEPEAEAADPADADPERRWAGRPRDPRGDRDSGSDLPHLRGAEVVGMKGRLSEMNSVLSDMNNALGAMNTALLPVQQMEEMSQTLDEMNDELNRLTETIC